MYHIPLINVEKTKNKIETCLSKAVGRQITFSQITYS